jgi:hypothetical protein
MLFIVYVVLCAVSCLSVVFYLCDMCICERGPLSLVSKTEELLGRKSSGYGLEIQEYCHRGQATEFLCVFVCCVLL